MTKYCTLMVRSYYIEDYYVVNKYCVMGQRKDTLNWDLLDKGYEAEADAILAMRNMNVNDLPMCFSDGVMLMPNKYHNRSK